MEDRGLITKLKYFALCICCLKNISLILEAELCYIPYYTDISSSAKLLSDLIPSVLCAADRTQEMPSILRQQIYFNFLNIIFRLIIETCLAVDSISAPYWS